MKIVFHDRRAFPLGSLEVGKIAVAVIADSLDRRAVFTKIVVPAKFANGGEPKEMVIDLSKLHSQYFDNISLAQPVVLLEKGESVEFVNS